MVQKPATLEEKIKARIEALKEEQRKFVEEANARLTAYNAAIAELTQLLQPEVEKAAE